MNDQNPFSSIFNPKSENKINETKSLFGSSGLGVNSIFGNQENQSSSLFGTNASNNIFSNFGNNNTNLGNSLFNTSETKKEGNDQKLKLGNSLFGINDNDKNIEKQKKNEENSGSLFGNSNNFGNGGLFGAPKQDNNAGGGLFGVPKEENKKSGGLFEASNNTGSGGLFGAPKKENTGIGGLFDAPKKENTGSGGLFDVPKKENTVSGAIFVAPKQDNTVSGAIFGAPKKENTGIGGLFNAPKQDNAGSGGLFDAPKKENTVSGAIFGAPKKENTGSGAIFVAPKQDNAVSGAIFGAPKQDNIGSSALFGAPKQDNAGSGGLFGAPKQENTGSGGLFGVPKQENTGSGGLFGAPKQENTGSGALFGAPKQENAGSGAIFGVPKQENTGSGGLFGAPKQENTGSGGLFGAPKQDNTGSSGLFGAPKQENNESNNTQKKENTNLFSPKQKGNDGGLFGAPKKEIDKNIKNSGIFTSLNQENNLFSSNTNKNSNNESNKLSENNDEMKSKNDQKSIFTTSNNNIQTNVLKETTLFTNNNYNPINASSQPNNNLFGTGNSNTLNNLFGTNNTPANEDKTPKPNKSNNINNQSIFNINTTEMSTSSIFNNNNENNKNQNNLMMKLSNRENVDINNDNDIDMDVEDNNVETSSTNSENINYLWMSDEENIIDDDTDANKKIDYKKIEEESKSIPNNINKLNSLIIPELSEFYFKKCHTTSDYYINSDSNIKDKDSVEISSKIIKILNDKIENMTQDEETKNELINLTAIYMYFDAFLLHRDDIVYLMKLRDELLYKYFIPIETIMNLDKKNRDMYLNNNGNIDSIANTLKNIYFNLSMLDIDKAGQKMMELIRLYKDVINKKKAKLLGDKTMQFNELFLNMERIIKIYNDIYKLKENFNSKQIISAFNMNPIFQEIKETIFNLERDISHNRNENVQKIFIECQKICGILSGDLKYIINDYNKNNIHLIIMGNIFYRFYLNDFIRGLQRCLDTLKEEYDKDNNLVNKSISRIIKNCDSKQIEIVQELKGKYLFLLRYHMIEILSQNAFLFQVENQEKYLKKEAYLFFHMMRDIKIPFKYYLNYFLFYPNFEIFVIDKIDDLDRMDDDNISNEIKEEGYRRALDYALIYISYRFSEINSDDDDDVEELVKEINEIKEEIKTKIANNYSNDVIYKINKLCLNKFLEKNIFKYSILCYIDNYNIENKDFQKLQIRQQRNVLCAENDLNFDYSKQFDKVIINLYLKSNYLFDINEFRKLYANNREKVKQEYEEYRNLLKAILNKKEISSVDNYVNFIINYIEFLLDVIKHNINTIQGNMNYNVDIVTSIKKFYESCFPLPKCPSFIWYHILIILKTVIDNNISLFNNDTFLSDNDDVCEQIFIWDEKLIYNLIKIEKLKKNKIGYEEAQKMYENAITFLNDFTQGVYINQNLFSFA